ncbi:hypothetical protein VPH35_100979 [Triticum aestivum]
MSPPPTAAAAGGGRCVDACDMSSGRWESACPFMSENLSCGKYGRTDLRYPHWRWQPHGCDLPRYVRAILIHVVHTGGWRRPSIKVRWGSFDTPAAKVDEYYGVTKAVDGVRAFELSLATWADWLEFQVDRARTRLLFMTMSPTHLPSDERADDAGGGASHGCYNETEPIAAAEEGGRCQRDVVDPAFARAVEEQARRLARDPSSYADCIHWCLPGVNDVWNQLLYAHIVS